MAGVCIVEPEVHGDSCGWFMETYSERALHALGIAARFVQDNMSYSAQTGMLRGIHFQNAPMVQAKLVRVKRGTALDVAVGLSWENRRMLYLPAAS